MSSQSTQGTEPTRVRNRFLTLCSLASQEKWCWKLECSTCGHEPFQYGLQAIAEGQDPESEAWSVHRSLRGVLGPPPRVPFSIGIQRALLEHVSSVDIDELSQEVRFPDWLGHLGLGLHYSQNAEEESGKATSSLPRQLVPYVWDDSPARRLLETFGSYRRLRWEDLESIQMYYKRS